MKFGEKLKKARLALDLSQTELSQKTGISERSLYTYEQTGIMPRSNNLRKLADALNVSVSYLLDENETDPTKNIEEDIFIANSKNKFGYKGAREASDISPEHLLCLQAESSMKMRKSFFSVLLLRYISILSNKRAKSFLQKSVQADESPDYWTVLPL